MRNWNYPKKVTSNAGWVSAIVCCVNPFAIVIREYPSEYDAFNDSHGQQLRLDFIKLFFFERGKKALHSGIVIATTGSGHTLGGFVRGQGSPKLVACVLWASIWMENYFTVPLVYLISTKEQQVILSHCFFLAVFGFKLSRFLLADLFVSSTT